MNRVRQPFNVGHSRAGGRPRRARRRRARRPHAAVQPRRHGVPARAVRSGWAWSTCRAGPTSSSSAWATAARLRDAAARGRDRPADAGVRLSGARASHGRHAAENEARCVRRLRASCGAEGRVPRLFERVTIAGVGLIGGSLALAARAAGLIGEVVGLGRSDRQSRAGARNAASSTATVTTRTTPRATPTCCCSRYRWRRCRRWRAPPRRRCALVPWSPTSGSVKSGRDPRHGGGAAARRCRSSAPTRSPAPSAPAPPRRDADLFRGSRCILTPGAAHRRRRRARRSGRLWEGVGMHVVEMDAARHDQILAWVSHLPHVLAFSAVDAAGRRRPRPWREFAGPSFRDLTRVAASPVDMWRDILLANADAGATPRSTPSSPRSTRLRQRIARRDADGLRACLAATRARRAWRGRSERDGATAVYQVQPLSAPARRVPSACPGSKTITNRALAARGAGRRPLEYSTARCSATTRLHGARRCAALGIAGRRPIPRPARFTVDGGGGHLAAAARRAVRRQRRHGDALPGGGAVPRPRPLPHRRHTRACASGRSRICVDALRPARRARCSVRARHGWPPVRGRGGRAARRRGARSPRRRSSQFLSALLQVAPYARARRRPSR